jgi:hypothetical protein
VAYAFDAAALLRLLAWILALAIGLATYVKRPDAAGRAFAFWTVVWAGGIQLVLTLQGAATDAGTQLVLYRAAYYATFCSTAFAAILLYAPARAPRATWAAFALLVAPALAALAFAGDHGAFLVEGVQQGNYIPANSPAMTLFYHVVLWTGFSLAMLALAWRAPALPDAQARAATWLMAGLALFAADRFARTWTWWLRDPATLPAGLEGQVYAFFIMGAFGVGISAMLLRARALPGADVRIAALVGLVLGGASFLTYGVAALGGGSTAGVVVSALLGPAYTWLLARGVLATPTDAVALAQGARAAVLAEA